MPRIIARVLAGLLIFFITVPLAADGPGDNLPDKVRRIPKLGIEVPPADREELERGLAELADLVAQLQGRRKDERIRELLPDVEIFHRAVDQALTFQEFFASADIRKAKSLLEVGRKRARELLAGHAPWTRQTGLVVRGYVSRLDGTVQPYGLIIPESYSAECAPVRCDLWFHGRGETLSEVNFIDQRMKLVGQYAPPDTIVVHPYGRYSNAFKFAGEVDVLEALESVKSRYRIDDDRVAVRGFSMGGAACWQFAVHYADCWFAANPGAGFSETPEFLRTFQQETLNPTWYERKLWHWYDCTDYAVNLFHCPTIAYSGELDRQKQAADIMDAALEREGIDLVHIIGPQTKHRIHPDSKIEIERRLESLAEVGRQHVPRTLHFTTWTLKYNRMHWVTVNALEEHWSQARVDGEILGSHEVHLTTQNVTDLALSMPPGRCPLDITRPVALRVDGEVLEGPRPRSDRSWTCRLFRNGIHWRVGEPKDDGGLRKRHNLQGPIDDAFMDSFLVVTPTGTPKHPAIAKWVQAEQEHAVVHWRRHFRGDARVKTDETVSDADIASANLILFGDPSSNAILRRIAAQLPIRWTEEEIVVGDRRFDAARHALIMIYPNPLNPDRYVVLNSGFTFREYDYLNNARQVPKLPDWAVVDVSTPPHSRGPGRIADADFFGERWELRPPRAATAASE